MQQQVHKEDYLVAKQHIGAVERAAGACQVVDIYSRTERSNRKRWQNCYRSKAWHKTNLRAQRFTPSNLLKNMNYWDVNVTGALTRLSAGIRKPNTLFYICGSLRVQFVFTSQKHISLTARVRKPIWDIKHSYQLLMRTLPSREPPSEVLSTISVSSWQRWCSISAGEIKLFLLAAPQQPPGSPRQQSALSPSACLCIMSTLQQAPEKINASDNWPIILLWLLLPPLPRFIS